MRRVRLNSLNDFAEWRVAARALLLQGTHPEDVVWEDPSAAVDLFADQGYAAITALARHDAALSEDR